MSSGKWLPGEFEELLESAYREFQDHPNEDEEILEAYNDYTGGYRFTIDEARDAFRGAASGTLEEWYLEEELPEIIGEDTLRNSFLMIDAESVDTVALESEYYLSGGYVFRR